jgi:hypothetical protein
LSADSAHVYGIFAERGVRIKDFRKLKGRFLVFAQFRECFYYSNKKCSEIVFAFHILLSLRAIIATCSLAFVNIRFINVAGNQHYMNRFLSKESTNGITSKAVVSLSFYPPPTTACKSIS